MLLLRQANDSDLELILSWRSNPLVYQGFYTQKEPLTWEEHLRWWKSRNSDWHQFIVVLVDDTRMRDIGVLTIVQCDNWSPEIGFYIGEVSLWGQGLGKEIVKLAEDWAKSRGYKQLHTTAPRDNKRTISVLKCLGWLEAGHARKGELRFEKEL